MYSGFTGKPLRKSKFLKQYSKIKYITVCLCDIVKVRKIKRESLEEAIPQGFLYARRRWEYCRDLTEGRFCEDHQKEENRRYEKYGRDPAVRRRYGRAWKRIRDKYASEHPLCEQCLKEGRYVKTEEIHAPMSGAT